MQKKSPRRPRAPVTASAGVTARLTTTGVAITAFLSGHAKAADAAATDLEQPTLPSVEVTGTAIQSSQDISSRSTRIDKKELAEQNLTLVAGCLAQCSGRHVEFRRGRRTWRFDQFARALHPRQLLSRRCARHRSVPARHVQLGRDFRAARTGLRRVRPRVDLGRHQLHQQAAAA